MIIITPPEYHGRKCNVCGEKDACCEINFRNDHHNHGIVVALCRDCVSTLSYLTEEQRGYNFPIREKRMDNCPLIPVPPHGRLGDLDRLEQMFVDIDNAPYSGFDGTEPFYSAEDAAQIIRLAPTIIPAEEE